VQEPHQTKPKATDDALCLPIFKLCFLNRLVKKNAGKKTLKRHLRVFCTLDLLYGLYAKTASGGL